MRSFKISIGFRPIISRRRIAHTSWVRPSESPWNICSQTAPSKSSSPICLNQTSADQCGRGRRHTRHAVLDELHANLRSLGPALTQENKALQATGEIRDRLEALAKTNFPQTPDAPLLATGVHEFRAPDDPSQVYRVTFGGAGHLECSCEGFGGEATANMFERLEEFHRQSGIRTRFPSLVRDFIRS